jgi:putative addiction module antidote
MIALKITTIGNSLGVILPKEALARMHVAKGDNLYLVESPDGYQLTPYDKELIKQLELAEDVMKEDRETLKALAK